MKIVKKRHKISPKQRALITSKSFRPGCVITELAKSYGVTPGVIYRWRNNHKSKNLDSQTSAISSDNFLEVVVTGSKPMMLQKADLVFEDMSLLVQGKISGSKLLAIVKALEASC